MRIQLAFTTALLFLSIYSFSQNCSVLRPQRSVTFNTSGECAPVDVTDFTITYSFSIPQDPNDITIRFIWNDPTNSVMDVSNGGGLIATDGNTTFQATGTFSYTRDPNCFFEPQSFILVDGILCESSEQIQLVTSWDNDDSFGGVMAIDPNQYNVCENTAISNAVFSDASTFNCNITASPDNANQLQRFTQFVYGTNHNLANAIRDVSLNDGSNQALTNGTGALSVSDTRGTVGELVTGAYFGVIEPVPFPADVPTNVSFPISAPASASNAIGNTFEITLFNWNTCNPYNGDAANPNYEDAVRETVNLTIVAPPNPSYQARLGNAGGTIGTLFCIETDIYFENLTPGGPYNYSWEFYSGNNTGTGIAGTSSATNPIFQYADGGDKLVRLIASDPNVTGVCVVIFDEIITISPDAVANFEFYNAGFTSVIDPNFCQTGGDTFTVGFRDVTTNVQPNTEFLYEFFDSGNNLLETELAGGVYSPTPIADFTKSYTTEEYIIVRLTANNSVTGCQSIDQDTVFVYGIPQPLFESDSICTGSRTHFSNIADPITSLTAQVNGDQTTLYEWDFSYDGAFNIERSSTYNMAFDWYLDGVDIATGAESVTSMAGTYTVALRMTTDPGICSDLITAQVAVHPNPDAQLGYDAVGAICPDEPVLFTNNSTNALSTTYRLEISHSYSGYLSQIDFQTLDTLIFTPNPDDSTRFYRSVVIAESEEGCITTSNELFFRVNPDEKVGFSDALYDPTGSNCSDWLSTLTVNQATQNLNADSYQWSIYDGSNFVTGFPITKNNGNPAFNTLDYSISNTGNSNRNYLIILEATKLGLCITSDSLTIQISPQPNALFTLLRDEDCNEVVFELDATSKGLSNYDWTFNPTPDFVSGADDEMLIGYNREATTGNDFTAAISLVTTNLATCNSDPMMLSETVEKQRPDIIIDFTLSTDTLQLPDNTITITNNSSSGAGFIYEWDFGDGQSSNLQNPGTHVYDRFGTYEINLKIIDAFCDEEDFKRLVVLPTDPILDFEGDILEGCAPLTVQFTNLSQYAQDGEYLWEFGDGSISRADNPAHTYFQDGEFSVRLRGKNEVGELFETEKTDYISIYQRPFADFLVSARIVYIPDQEALFKNLSENATSYFWDFGDGSTSIETEPRHAYIDEGEYDITLIATNAFGCVDTLFRAAEITAIAGGQVSSPNAFTPNLSGPTGGNVSGGSNPDRINDVFIPSVEGITKFRMLIYNKWGELLFESNSQNVGWDGYYKGRLAPSGVYVYKLELRYSDGQDVVKVGDVTLIK